jgi:predicted permease
MNTLFQDWRYGMRILLKKPGFMLIAIFTLALGIGANMAIFTWLKAILLQPLPGVAASHRLAMLHSALARSDNRVLAVSYPDYKDYRDRNKVFSGLAAFNLSAFNLLDGEGRPERVWGSLVSGNYFDVLGMRPILGRAFAPDEDRAPGADPVVVISHRLWRRRFAADPSLIGKAIRLNKRDFTVIGVAAEGFSGSFVGLSLDLWAPLMMAPQLSPSGDQLDRRDSMWLFVIGRLKDGVTFEKAQADVRNIAAQLAKDYPQTNGKLSAKLFTLIKEPYGAGQMAPVFVVLLIVTGLVLLIACANVAGLLLAAAAGRGREMGVRSALGASRGRLVRQMLTESLMLVVMGAAAGALLAAWLRNAMSLILPPMGLPLGLNLVWDYQVFIFASALTLLTVMAVGLVPALLASKVDPIASIRSEAGAASSLIRRSRLRGALVVAQIAVSVVSLFSAGLFIRTLVEERKVNLGFDSEGALLVSMDLHPNGYDEKSGVEFYRQLVERVRALPDVESASLSNKVPPILFSRNLGEFEIEGYEQRKDEVISVEYEVVAPRYFQTMRIPLIEGREYNETDHRQATPVVIVNETMARRYWAGQSPVGRRLRRKGSGSWSAVIGVARDVKNFGPTEPAQPWVYYTLDQQYDPLMTLVARVGPNPQQALASVLGVVRALDPALPVFDEKTLAAHSGASIFLERLAVILLSAFGLLALTLAAIGLYGMLAYAVSQRTREIGVRMALGARSRDVFRLVVGQGIILALIGMAIGLTASLALTRLMKNLLFGVTPNDPLTFAATVALLIIVVALSCYVPARRAIKVDPVVALRQE